MTRREKFGLTLALTGMLQCYGVMGNTFYEAIKGPYDPRYGQVSSRELNGDEKIYSVHLDQLADVNQALLGGSIAPMLVGEFYFFTPRRKKGTV